jgi:hypothetical protein
MKVGEKAAAWTNDSSSPLDDEFLELGWGLDVW